MNKALKIQKLVEGGQGFAFDDGKSYFVWNVLPGEEVEFDILKHRKGIYECSATNILKPSKHRIQPSEDHFLSCSPWQMMGFEYENEMKQEIALENYERIGEINIKKYSEILGNIEMYSDGIQYGYRNKMEFSFIEEGGKISLALFKRGQRRKVALDGCELASGAINKAARMVLDWVNKEGLTERNLKTLIVRSNKKGETIAGLFIKDRLDLNCRDAKFCAATGDAKILGFSLYYSTHKSPASVITDTLYQEGQDFLIEEIGRKKFKYGINSFFQVNIPVFEMALQDIADSVGATGSVAQEKGRSNGSPLRPQIVDYYSGVGAIGLSIGANTLVESNEEAVGFAQENIALSGIVGARFIAPVLAEKSLDYIQKDSILIFDPPRAGLHQDVIDRILEIKPRKIIYLSCNTATHARDIGLLKDLYAIKFLKLYNFFPRTPHIEALCVLELK